MMRFAGSGLPALGQVCALWVCALRVCVLRVCVVMVCALTCGPAVAQMPALPAGLDQLPAAAMARQVLATCPQDVRIKADKSMQYKTLMLAYDALGMAKPAEQSKLEMAAKLNAGLRSCAAHAQALKAAASPTAFLEASR